MKENIAKILRVENVTHDVKRFVIERPAGLEFIPGQAAEISINRLPWTNELRPFTFTGLTEWDHLEFTIKIYKDHHGVTEQLDHLKTGDELILHSVFGAIHYYGEGTFIAGGAGVTPFIAIFRQLEKEKKIGNNTLLFSNKTEADIILKDEFSGILGENFINTLTQQDSTLYDKRKIDKKYLEEKIKNWTGYFYLCGPDPMVETLKQLLINLRVKEDKIIIEQF